MYFHVWFASLVGIPIGITSSSVLLKSQAITAGIKIYKSILETKRANESEKEAWDYYMTYSSDNKKSTVVKNNGLLIKIRNVQQYGLSVFDIRYPCHLAHLCVQKEAKELPLKTHWGALTSYFVSKFNLNDDTSFTFWRNSYIR